MPAPPPQFTAQAFATNTCAPLAVRWWYLRAQAPFAVAKAMKGERRC
jgi:hypothetical protein